MKIEDYIKESFEKSYQEAKEDYEGFDFSLKELYDFAAEKSIAISKYAISLVYKSTAQAIRESYCDETALEIADELQLAAEEFEEKPVDPLDEKYRALEEERMRDRKSNLDDLVIEPINPDDLFKDEEEDECLPF